MNGIWYFSCEIVGDTWYRINSYFVRSKAFVVYWILKHKMKSMIGTKFTRGNSQNVNSMNEMWRKLFKNAVCADCRLKISNLYCISRKDHNEVDVKTFARSRNGIFQVEEGTKIIWLLKSRVWILNIEKLRQKEKKINDLW